MESHDEEDALPFSSKGLAVPKLFMNHDDPTCLALNHTGRWIELLIPVGHGEVSFICTCAYGYSGASSGGDVYATNETFIAHLISRAAQHDRAAAMRFDMGAGSEEFGLWSWPRIGPKSPKRKKVLQHHKEQFLDLHYEIGH